MEGLDHVKAEVARLFAAKEARRQVKLQQMAAPILRARGHNVQPWQIDG